MFDGQPYYKNYPYFTHGLPNQWYETEYFFMEGKFYRYEDDRSAASYRVNEITNTFDLFEEYAQLHSVTIPEEFRKAISK